MCNVFPEKDDTSIDIYTPNRIYRKELTPRRRVAVWQVKYKGHPKPTLEWYNNLDRIITTYNDESREKYEVNITSDYTILKINSLTGDDSGNYTLKAYNRRDSMEKKFELIVRGS